MGEIAYESSRESRDETKRVTPACSSLETQATANLNCLYIAHRPPVPHDRRWPAVEPVHRARPYRRRPLRIDRRRDRHHPRGGHRPEFLYDRRRDLAGLVCKPLRHHSKPDETTHGAHRTKPPSSSELPKHPLRTVRSENRSVGASVQSHTQPARVFYQELLGLGAREGRQVEHLLLARATVSHPLVAEHLFPAGITRARNGNTVEQGQHPTGCKGLATGLEVSQLGVRAGDLATGLVDLRELRSKDTELLGQRRTAGFKGFEFASVGHRRSDVPANQKFLRISFGLGAESGCNLQASGLSFAAKMAGTGSQWSLVRVLAQRARSYWFVLVPLVALWELLAHASIVHGVPTEADWRAAHDYIARERRSDDLVASAPLWTDPLARMHFAELISLRDAARADATAYPRVFLATLHHGGHPDFRDWTEERHADFGSVTVRVLRNPHRARVLYDFLEHLQPPDARVDRASPSAAVVSVRVHSVVPSDTSAATLATRVGTTLEG